MSEELKEFDINLDDIEENVYLFNNINEAVQKLKTHIPLADRFEVVLNNNLIETKDKYTGFRTILGCRVSYDNLDKNVSFIVREDTKPSYETLEKRIDKAIEYINEYAWQEDIIGDMWTTTGEPVKDRYMRLEWDNCNELLEILKGSDKE